MIDYKTKCLSILEGVNFAKSMWEFPLIQSVHGNPVDGWELTYLGGKTIQCNQWMSVSDSVIAYALLSHRVPQPDENGLLPCFRCNGKAELTSRYIANSSTDDEYVCCIECGLRTREHETETGAMEDWNRRANQGGPGA